ncbi:NERD domain-containing protein [Streptomyces sp. BI20]|uniref:NERD domain-containing protein n=1 Tax=Streptomyces sp. BI20 TaxID=3403460 RepID=UPI003C7668E0
MATREARVVPDARGRLWVSLPDGRVAAWYDRDTGRVTLLVPGRRDAVLTALRPLLSPGWTIGPPPVPGRADLARLALPPDEDLAPNRPGEDLHGVLDHGRGPAGPLGRRALRRELRARELVGAALDALEPAGWRVLHELPLPAGEHVHHLAIGPAGVLCVRTVPAGGHRVRCDADLVRIGRAVPRPDPRLARRAADLAARALAAAVTPVLALAGAGADRIDRRPDARDLLVLADTELDGALTGAGPTLKPAEIAGLYARARDRRTWR